MPYAIEIIDVGELIAQLVTQLVGWIFIFIFAYATYILTWAGIGKLPRLRGKRASIIAIQVATKPPPPGGGGSTPGAPGGEQGVGIGGGKNP